MKTFEKELPQGYVEAKVIDAKEKKVIRLFTLFALAMTAVFFVIGSVVIKPWDYALELEDRTPVLIAALVFLAVDTVTFVIHELLHGIVYKILTKQKLTFGLTKQVAYCGVPDIYVYRTTALLSLLAPFVVLGLTFLLLTVFLSNPLHKFLALVMLGIHIGGCIGDLFDTYLFLFKFRSSSTLMLDNGPKQIIYVKDNLSTNDNKGE